MRCLAPVDEERDNPASQDGARIRVAPRQKHSVRSSSAAGSHFSQLDAFTPGIAGQFLEVLSLGCPCYEPGLLQFVDTKRTRLRRLGLFRVGTDDFQVDAWSE